MIRLLHSEAFFISKICLKIFAFIALHELDKMKGATDNHATNPLASGINFQVILTSCRSTSGFSWAIKREPWHPDVHHVIKQTWQQFHGFCTESQWQRQQSADEDQEMI